MTELWGDIDDNYKISTDGNVINKRTNKMLKPYITKYGYLRIDLRDDNARKQYHIHQLVAKIFIPNPDDKPQVNHINGDKQDNRIENLEWVTAKENRNHAIEINLVGKPVLQFNLAGDFIQEFPSATKASRFLNKSNAVSISVCCLGKQYTAFGFKWKFKNEER